MQLEENGDVHYDNDSAAAKVYEETDKPAIIQRIEVRCRYRG